MAKQASAAVKAQIVETRDPEEFANVLKQSFKPRTDRAATEVENAVTTLVREALADTTIIQDDVLDTIESMIARLDEKLSAQVNAILHAPEFQQMESAWRGLRYLVYNSETDANLKIRVMNVSKTEIYRNLRLFPGARWDQSPLFKAVYEAEFGQLGGEPFGCMVGDYYFSHQPTDVQLLRDLSKVFGQYLKDCFCEHFLVDCPDCHGDEKIYLGSIQIMKNPTTHNAEVYKICNFTKRRYVKSEQLVEYWLSAVPIIPVLKQLVADLCCKVVIP